MKAYQFFCVGLLLSLGLLAWGHRMEIAYSIEPGAIILEAWMGRDEAVSGGDVTITSETGKVLLQGTTDADGFFTWVPEAPATATVQVYGGQGHGQTITIPSSDVEMALAQAEPKADPQTASSPGSSTAVQTASSSATPTTSTRMSTESTLSTPIRVVIGFTFLFSGMAAWLSYSNSRRLHALEKKLGGPDE